MLILRQTYGYLGQAKVVEHRSWDFSKLDNLIQSSPLSSLVLTQYKVLLINQF